MQHLKRIFENVNGCPTWVTTQTIELMQDNVSNISTSTTSNESKTTNNHTIIVPCKGKRAKHVSCNINKDKSRVLLEDRESQIVYARTKLGSKNNKITA